MSTDTLFRIQNKKQISERTYHDCDVVPIIVGERSVSAEQVLLSGQEGVQILRVEGHQLDHVFQSVIVQECIHEGVLNL